MEEKILPILKEFGMDKTNLPMEEDVLKYANSIKNVTIDEIKNEMIEYIKNIWKYKIYVGKVITYV